MSSSTAEGENRSLLRSTSTSPRPTPIPRRQGSYGAISTSGHSDDSTSTSDTAATETEESRLSVKNDGDKTPIKVAKKFSEIWPSILGLSTAVFCSALGATVVANIQVEVGSYFKAGSLSSWLGTGYLLGLAAMTPLYGRLAEIWGRKAAILLALSLFFIGTLLCAIAPSMTTILIARGIAGMGSGGILTVTAIIITDLVSIADRGLYQGGVNLLFGAGAATGAVVGGAIADGLGWRAAFWLQIPPIALSAFLIVMNVKVPRPKSDQSAWEKLARIDWAGTVALVTSVSTLSIGTSLATSSGYPWTHPLVIGLLVLFVVSVPIFLWIESRATEPIMPLSILTRSQPILPLAGLFWLTGANFSRLYMQPVYLHVTRGLNGRDTGLALLPSTIVGSTASLYAGWHMKYFREYKWFQFTVSLVPWLQGLSIICFWGPDTSVHRLWVEIALGALGTGAVITSLMTTLINCVETHELSLAISACYLFRSLGQVVGVAIAAAVQQAVLGQSLSRRLGHTSGKLVRRIIEEPAIIIPKLDAATRLQARLAYLDSVDGVFVFIVVIGAILSAICLAVRARPLE